MAQIQWPRGRPQAIERFPFAREVQAIVRRAQPQQDEIVRLARPISERYSKGDFRDVFQAYLDLCSTIDVEKVRAIGFDRHSVSSNYFMRILGLTIIQSLQPTAEQVNYATELFGQVREAEGPEGWFYPKVKTFASFLRYK